MAVHLYAANKDMRDRYFVDADGELLFVPELNAVDLHTELGPLRVSPGEIAVIPRGIRFRVELPDKPARGYLCENFGAAFTLPERGPIGANGLANERDFLTPHAAFEERDHAGHGRAASSAATSGPPTTTTRRSTWSPGTATTCRTSTTRPASW